MNWYYAAAGKQTGPVTEEQLGQLVAAGQVTDDTLVWREGMPDWAPYRTIKPAAAEPAEPLTTTPTFPAISEAPGAVCSECGNMFPVSEMIRHGQAYICAGCKPVFLQKLAEGANIGGGGSTLTEEQLLAREYKVEIGETVSRSWNAFTNNAGVAIGAVVVVGIVFLVCWAISAVASLLFPFANGLLSILYTVPLTAGLLWFFLRLIRGENPTVGDSFSGFSGKYGQLLLFGLTQLGITLMCLAPLIAAGIVVGITSSVMRHSRAPDLSSAAVASLIIAGLVSLCAVVYVNTLFTHALLLMMDKNYRFWPAMQLSRKMVSKRWWMTFLFLIVAGILESLGAFACLVGMLATVPLYFGMKAAIYDDNFRDLTPQG